MKVLIADDSRTERLVLHHLLERWGYEVAEAADGDEALRRIEADEDIGIAVLDWVMPGTDGLQVCQRLQALDRLVYAILVTGIGKPEDVARALDNGASDYVVKPFDQEQLRARLRVGVRLIELKRKIAHAEKMESVGRLSAGLAHELNTPAQYVGDNLRYVRESFAGIGKLLSGVRSALECDGEMSEAAAANLREAMEEADLDFLLEDVPRALDQATSGVERIAAIVESMSRVVRSTTAARKDTDLAALVRGVLAHCALQWDGVAHIRTELDSALPPVACFAEDLDPAIEHVLSNAVDAVREAHAATGGRGHIVVRTRRDGDWAEIRVRDDGVGMSADTRTRMFDPFFTTKPLGNGTGQGMGIVHDIVVGEHNGNIEIDSRQGKGTIVILRLPITHAEPACEQTPPTPAHQGLL